MSVPNPCYDPEGPFKDEYDYLPYLPEEPVSTAINVLNIIVLVAIAISYIPQLYAAYRQKSTFGISFGTMHIANFSLFTSLSSLWMVSIQKFLACTQSLEQCYPSLISLAQSFIMFAGLFWFYCLLIRYLHRENRERRAAGLGAGEDDTELLLEHDEGEESGAAAQKEKPEDGTGSESGKEAETAETSAEAGRKRSRAAQRGRRDPGTLHAPPHAPSTFPTPPRGCACITKPLISEEKMRKITPAIMYCFLAYMAISACLTTSVGMCLGVCSPVNSALTYFYSLLAPILSMVQWLPQIIKTIVLKDGGIFSLSMLCIQVPICVLMVVFMFLTEVSWLAAISAITAAIQMGLLAILISYYRIKQRLANRRANKAIQVPQGLEEREESAGND